jgi:Tol biopolymer transport system component/DNA-binding winged helix-turn-helix (wHTH) protein
VEPTAPLPNSVRFGLFEADLTTGELRKRGRKVPLQDQPFQVLALLLRHPGEIIAREELQRALWPADTFVEFEHGVNTAIKKLRQALGDSADNPRFIETLPRKGYRFIAPVEDLATESGRGCPAPASATASRSQAPKRRSRGSAMRGWWGSAGVGVVVVAAGCAVWLAYRPGARTASVPAAVPLTSYPGWAWMPSFSPDGERVAFAWDGGQKGKQRIYVKQIGEEQPVRLTEETEDASSPAWSPDGRWIAFVRTMASDRGAVFLMPAIGGAEHKLAEMVPPVGESTRTSWHPGGRWLAVTNKTAKPEPLALFLVSVETGEKRRLTSPPEGVFGDFDPAFSPDGRAVVFARRFGGTASELCLLELTDDLRPTGEPKRITFMGGHAAGPAWWPDGKSILFFAGDYQDSALWRIGLRGTGRTPSEPERLPFGGGGIWHYAAVSRQGRIVYTQASPGSVHIWRLELGGSQRAAMMPMSSARLDHTPQYSPDGKQIAFASNRSGSNEIWVCNADGSNVRKLTSFGGPYVANPAWSPDGRRIAFTVASGEASDLYWVNEERGKPKRVPESLSKDGDGTWSHDGKWFYVSSKRSGESQLWKIPLDGGAAMQLTRRGCAGHAVESPDGRFVYYLRSAEYQGSTELWRVPSGGGGEVPIAQNAAAQHFSVNERGVYLLSGWGGVYFFSGGSSTAVQCYNFATRKVETVGRIKDQSLAWGISVSPDSRWLLYSAWDPNSGGSSLMMVEKFR